jgi:hypothetical protein
MIQSHLQGTALVPHGMSTETVQVLPSRKVVGKFEGCPLADDPSATPIPLKIGAYLLIDGRGGLISPLAAKGSGIRGSPIGAKLLFCLHDVFLLC